MASSNATAKLVAIGTDQQFLDFLAKALSGSPVEVITPADPQEGLKIAFDEPTDIVLLDVSMLPWNGLELLRKVANKNPRTHVVLLTEQSSRGAALEAGQMGVSDCMDKSTSAEGLHQRLSKFVPTALGRQKPKQLGDRLLEAYQFEGIVGCSPLMLEVFDQIRRFASHFRNILGIGRTTLYGLLHPEAHR